MLGQMQHRDRRPAPFRRCCWHSLRHPSKDLTAAAKTNENLMPKILNAVKTYATLGETINALKEIFGEYKENIVL